MDRRVTKSVKVWNSPEDLPRVLGEVCVALSQGEYGEDCVSSSLNTQPLQPDIQLSQQLELVYQITVFTVLLLLFAKPFHFLIQILLYLIVTA